nr:DUF4244 domain-containing protein [Rothia nasimurium]
MSNTHPTSPVVGSKLSRQGENLLAPEKHFQQRASAPDLAEGQVFQAGLDDPEAGATTAEYGIVMLAAVGFAGLLVVILKSEEVRQMLLGLVQTALSTGA